MAAQTSRPHAFPLALAGEGEDVRIFSFKGGKGLSYKLMDLGLSIGSRLRIIQRRPGGALVVARDNLRVALGEGMAQKVVVALCDETLEREAQK